MNEQKINRLKSETVSAFPKYNPEVEGFENFEGNTIKVLLTRNRFTIVDLLDLQDFDENAEMFLSEAKYYHREINDILESYISETEDLLIQKED